MNEMKPNNNPEYELEDLLIKRTGKKVLEFDDRIPYEKVVKSRFWDIDEEEYWYRIGLEDSQESYEMHSESYLDENYRRISDKSPVVE